MALAHSPRVITSNLVFYYDVANVKSFKGTPTINLIDNPTPNGTTTGWTRAGNTGTLVYDTTERAIKWTETAHAVWGSYMTAAPSFTGTLDNTANYSISFDWRISTNNSLMHYGYQLVQGNGVGSAITTVALPTYSTLKSDGWNSFRYTTIPLNTGEGLAFNRVLFTPPGGGANANSHIMYVRNFQFEKSNVVTPFVAGTRSNTQSMFDMLGSNELTVSNLVPTNTTPLFSNTISSHIAVANNPALQFLGTAPYTLEAWIKPTSYPANNYYSGIFHRENTDTGARDGYSIFFVGNVANSQNVQIQTERFSTGNVHPSIGKVYPGEQIVNVYSHIVSTFDGSVLRMYRNGILEVSSTPTSNAIFNTTAVLRIGRLSNWYFTGDIPVAKVYNRALSQTEILQNFNALRGRFGL